MLQLAEPCQGSQHAKISKLTLNLGVQMKSSSPGPGFILGFPETEFHPDWKLHCYDKVLKVSSTHPPSTRVQWDRGMSQIPVSYHETQPRVTWPGHGPP